MLHAEQRAEGCAGQRPGEVREIRTGILLPAVSPISQRRPDYIKSFNPGLRPKPAVQVFSRGGEGGREKNPSKIDDGIQANIDDRWLSVALSR